MPSNRQNSSRDVELSRLLAEKIVHEAELEALTLRIGVLKRKIIEVQAEYGAVYNEPAPLLTLSTEVTCLIFDYAIAAGYPRERRTSTEQEEKSLLVEVVVSHVCHKWRSISIAYSRLWTNFCYDGPLAPRLPIDRLDAYLERSASQTLELWFDFREPGEGQEAFRDQLDLFERAIPAIVRWKRVTVISDPIASVSSLLLKLELVSAPNIEHFAFYSKRPSYESVGATLLNNDLEPTIFRNGAPKLQSVVVDCSSLQYVCLPPLSNITTLRLESLNNRAADLFCSWTTILHVLSLPYLENLSLVGYVLQAGDYIQTGSPITMNRLKYFRSSNHFTPPWLLFLRAPLLETLICHSGWINDVVEDNPQSYAFPSLRSVSLIETKVQTSQAACRFAKMTGSVTEIICSEGDHYASIFSLLPDSQERWNENYWINVVRITFVSKTIYTFDHILRFARSRCTNNLIIRVFDYVDDFWRKSFPPEEYEALTEVCTIEKMVADDNPLWNGYWPLGEHHPVHLVADEDPFDIETFHR